MTKTLEPIERVKLETLPRIRYEWVGKPDPIPVVRVIKPFVAESTNGRGLTLKEIVLWGTDNKFLPGKRRVKAFQLTLEQLCNENVLKFVPQTDRYYLDSSVDVASVRASIKASEISNAEKAEKEFKESQGEETRS